MLTEINQNQEDTMSSWMASCQNVMSCGDEVCQAKASHTGSDIYYDKVRTFC
jgi:hypothetical protein